MQRQIDAPDWEWGSAEQAAAWLGIDVKTFKALVREGGVPPPATFDKLNRRWHWSTVYALSVLAPWLLENRVKPKTEKS